jgi:hypothetical protein
VAKSAVSALFDLYNSIAAANFGGTTRPTLFMGEAAQTTAAAAPQRVPYVVLFDEGFRPEFDSSSGGHEMGEIRLEVYALKLDDASGVTVDSVVRGIKWGGSAPASKAGFDWGTLAFAAGSYLYKIHLKRTFERRSYAGFDQDNARVHKCELRYECVTGVSPT